MVYVPGQEIEKRTPWAEIRERRKAEKLERERSGVREEDVNPDDCRCGRAWYPRFDHPTSRKFTKICPGCGLNISECNCGL